MKTTIKVNDVKCGNCCNFIHKELGKLQGVFGVKVDQEGNEVTVEHTEEVAEEAIQSKLEELGYGLSGK
ncbi:heavy-metal-associated domain-containing protein [Odoribacter sp. OttesenSCG-928-J03]|nr:heavy-metal-associated domain-containing protein [Odoribacter sp. OttesenSCG-928-J03]MDL2282997.1 heavy-metal-associated domain-containing protein [Odoribacter sp. OttesenSCG-928-G04]MDL2331109.1 heavy-metal-associated domain-containing protein [Odoribacter sp. OttesenSCG-928-A06]